MIAIARRVIGNYPQFPPGVPHLRQTLNEYVTHYNARHTHQSPEQDSPLGMVPVSRQGPIRYRKVLGGIIRDYYREAE